MREIKFRAWNPRTRKMSSGEITLVNAYCFVPDCVMMQFTGLKDKDRVEIYEGDIVRYWQIQGGATGVYKVKFNTGRFLLVHNVLDVRSMFVCGKYEQCEVIGNIYENPEVQTRGMSMSGR